MKDVKINIGLSMKRLLAGFFASGAIYMAALLIVGQTMTVQGVMGAILFGFALAVDDVATGGDEDVR